ncbi:MAG: glucose-6-phosphate isomerase [Rhodospirillaceae bacterium]|nr:glucose-6-phosphate isomerase [Rhodospirillaceae bacterium]
MSGLTESSAWKALESQRKSLARVPLGELFVQEPERFPRLAVEAAGLLLDYSKNLVTRRTLSLLLELARDAEVEDRTARMFAGERINTSEDRPALHVALRAPADQSISIDGRDMMPEIEAGRRRIADFAAAVREGRYAGFGGRRITDVVAIGIGGSYLGPALAVEALAAAGEGPRIHFVANVDGGEIAATLAGLEPATTLFIIISKTFTTAETTANAEAARRWFAEQGGPDSGIAQQFIAVSTNREAVARFGLDPERSFGFWDWVGGRFSLWSAVGLPIALGAGPERFAEQLAGAAAMDAHFREAPLARNMPVLLALIGIWNRNFIGCDSLPIVPYGRRLTLLPSFLQQLEMESNGKRVTRDGDPVDYGTAPVIWGGVGTNVQHAFFQALHQGPSNVPVDFPVARQGAGDAGQHRMLLANCLAQSEALMRGRDRATAETELSGRGVATDQAKRLAPHLVCPGNRPSNTILFERLDAVSLGALLALYEHKVFVQGTVWRVNSFDQWGVELGKRLAGTILGELEQGPPRPMMPRPPD